MANKEISKFNGNEIQALSDNEIKQKCDSFIEKINNSIQSAKEAKQELERVKNMPSEGSFWGNWTPFGTSDKEAMRNKQNALIKVEEKHQEVTRQHGELIQEIIFFAGKSLAFAKMMNDKLLAILASGFKNADGKTIKLSQEQKEIYTYIKGIIEKEISKDETIEKNKNDIEKIQRQLEQHSNQNSEQDANIARLQNELNNLSAELHKEIDSLKTLNNILLNNKTPKISLVIACVALALSIIGVIAFFR